MKKQLPVQISVPKPCHENWEAMTPAEQGRFCHSCADTVVDCTQMDDAAIIAMLQLGQYRCGRFTSAQLNRALQAAPEKPRCRISPAFKKLAAALLLCSSFSTKMLAQVKKQSATQQPFTPSRKAPILISGHVMEGNSQQPLKGFKIYLEHEDFELQTQTNKWGGFTFSIPAKAQKGNGRLVVNVSGTDYQFIDEYFVALDVSDQNVEVLCYAADTLDRTDIVPPPKALIGKVDVVREVSVGMYEKRKEPPLMDQVYPVPRKRNFWQRLFHPMRSSKKHKS